jgi:hypothetical protein
LASGRAALAFPLFLTAACAESGSPTPLEAPSRPEFSSVAPPGFSFGAFNIPMSQLSSRLSGTVILPTTKSVIKWLNAARAGHARVFIRMTGGNSKYKNPDGTFSLALWEKLVGAFQGFDLGGYVADGTLLGHYMVDEPNDPDEWGGHPISYADLDEMARYSKQLWPALPTVVRGAPTWLAQTPVPYAYLDAGWAQYSASKGNVGVYLASNLTAARNAGLGLVVGLNVLNGGTSASGIPGYSAGKYAMSASQLLSWGSVLLGDGFPCAFLMWKYDTTYFNRSDMSLAVDSLHTLAAAHPPATCQIR